MTKNQTYDDIYDKCLTALEMMLVPKVTVEQIVAFGILCARQVETDPRFLQWADKWLSGEDLSAESAKKMAGGDVRAARLAAEAAEWAAECSPVMAKIYAERAADWAIPQAAKEGLCIDFAALAKEAMKY